MRLTGGVLRLIREFKAGKPRGGTCPGLPWKRKLACGCQPCSARSILEALIVGKFEIVNASSFPQVTDKRNLPVPRSGRGGKRYVAPINSRENSLVLRVARVGYRITSRLERRVLAMISPLLIADCW